MTSFWDGPKQSAASNSHTLWKRWEPVTTMESYDLTRNRVILSCVHSTRIRTCESCWTREKKWNFTRSWAWSYDIFIFSLMVRNSMSSKSLLKDLREEITPTCFLSLFSLRVLLGRTYFSRIWPKFTKTRKFLSAKVSSIKTNNQNFSYFWWR